jgi:hypothetical protein
VNEHVRIRGLGVFIVEGVTKFSEKQGMSKYYVAYVWYYLHSSPKVVAYVQVLSKGYFKSRVHLCGPQRTFVYYL